eukprot:6496485-Prymnesium_polylepis.1
MVPVRAAALRITSTKHASWLVMPDESSGVGGVARLSSSSSNAMMQQLALRCANRSDAAARSSWWRCSAAAAQRVGCATKAADEVASTMSVAISVAGVIFSFTARVSVCS